MAAIGGADPNAKNDRGDTAYTLAARVGVPSTSMFFEQRVQSRLKRLAGNPPAARRWAAAEKFFQ
jgi:hypothetical protein